MFIVRFVNKLDGDSLYAGPPGINVNTGAMSKTSSVCQRKNAVRFASRRAAQRAAKCNDSWTAKIEETDE